MLAKDYREIPPPFKLEGMLYYSTLLKLELIGQVLSFKCNNVKEIQTKYHSPYKTGKLFFICTLVSFFHGSMCSVLGCASAISGQKYVAALALSGVDSPLQEHRQKMWFGEIQ